VELRRVVAWKSYVRVTVEPRVAAIAFICCTLGGAAWLGVAWWQPTEDFEQCAAKAGNTASSPHERTALIAQCDRQFAGRRKPDGGYTYYDFLQNRHFDIAGPNPTPSEMKHFDEEYALYLDTQRRDAVAAAAAEKQNLRELAELEDDRSKVVTAANVPILRTGRSAARSKSPCEDASLSCGWIRFSAGIRNFLASNAKLGSP
jgi:hypothetical protein